MPMGIEMLGSVESTAIRRVQDVRVYRMLSSRQTLCQWEASTATSRGHARTCPIHAIVRFGKPRATVFPSPAHPSSDSNDNDHQPRCRNVGKFEAREADALQCPSLGHLFLWKSCWMNRSGHSPRSALLLHVCLPPRSSTRLSSTLSCSKRGRGSSQGTTCNSNIHNASSHIFSKP